MPQCTSATFSRVERAGAGERHARPDRPPPSIDRWTGRISTNATSRRRHDGVRRAPARSSTRQGRDPEAPGRRPGDCAAAVHHRRAARRDQQPRKSRQATRVPLRNSDLMSAMAAGGVPVLWSPARDAKFDRWKPSGSVSDWATCRASRRSPMLPTHRARTRDMSIQEASPPGQYSTPPPAVIAEFRGPAERAAHPNPRSFASSTASARPCEPATSAGAPRRCMLPGSGAFHDTRHGGLRRYTYRDTLHDGAAYLDPPRLRRADANAWIRRPGSLEKGSSPDRYMRRGSPGLQYYPGRHIQWPNSSCADKRAGA